MSAFVLDWGYDQGVVPGIIMYYYFRGGWRMDGMPAILIIGLLRANLHPSLIVHVIDVAIKSVLVVRQASPAHTRLVSCRTGHQVGLAPCHLASRRGGHG